MQNLYGRKLKDDCKVETNVTCGLMQQVIEKLISQMINATTWRETCRIA